MAVVITTDWKLEQVAGKTFGMCRCSWSPPFERFDFEKGFSLPNPSNTRVACQSILWALEAVRGSNWLKPNEDTVVIATKHQHLHSLLTDPRYVPKWAESDRWPKLWRPSQTLLLKCYRLMKQLNAAKPDFVNLVYIEREEGDDAVVDLDENRTDDGFDMESFVTRGASQEEIDKALQKTSMMGVMAKKLLASGARCYRPKAR